MRSKKGLDLEIPGNQAEAAARSIRRFDPAPWMAWSRSRKAASWPTARRCRRCRPTPRCVNRRARAARGAAVRHARRGVLQVVEAQYLKVLEMQAVPEAQWQLLMDSQPLEKKWELVCHAGYAQSLMKDWDQARANSAAPPLVARRARARRLSPSARRALSRARAARRTTRPRARARHTRRPRPRARSRRRRTATSSRRSRRRASAARSRSRSSTTCACASAARPSRGSTTSSRRATACACS